MSSFKDPLPGVPRIESPFFSNFFNLSSCSPEMMRIAEALKDKGYAVFDFPDRSFDKRAERIISHLTPRLRQERNGTLGLYPGTRVQDAWADSPDVFELATNTEVLDLISTLYGRQAWPFQTLNFPKGTEQHYHTDALHFSSVPERYMCGIWVALEDIGPDQGPLEYYPGSHRWPIYSNEHIGRIDIEEIRTTQEAFHYMWESMVKATGVKKELFCAKKGQALIWTANLLHGGSAQLDQTKTRWSQVTHYYFQDCAYYTPMDSDPFRGLIKFREPTNIITRQQVGGQYNGKRIPQRFISEASVGFRDELTRESFDPQAYLLVNRDVLESGMDPWEHFIKYGKNEGRRIK